ncbi:hypothetical protein PWT90_03932 [Aphanocladium album]|nr:hypothetical protein PWT90_03932 [Aphanocladium album]
MSLTHAHVYSVLESYLASDFDTFVRQKCTPTFTYELVPGDVAAKLPLPSSSDSARQHEFAGVFLGPDTATRRILEGLTGRELEMFGDAKRTDRSFVLANAAFLEFDEELKIIYWSGQPGYLYPAQSTKSTTQPRSMSSHWTRVEFTAYDGTQLRGNWFAAQGTDKAPAVIMTQGLTLLKEHYLQNWAEHFQDEGYNVLTYDHRNFGHSESLPRNEVNLAAQADDYSAPVTFVQGLSGANPHKVFLWGIGHSGGASGTAAAFDRRIAGVILVMPSQTETRAAGRAASEARAGFWRFWPVSDANGTSAGEWMLSDPVSTEWAKGAFHLTEEGGIKFDNKVAIAALHLSRASWGVLWRDYPDASPVSGGDR